ncbi:hypothetical protein BHE74_00054298 [Ensete ventricosum]|nr:hypothetical protein GW17_00008314 [Ensete ventricosum]RWW40299.1 hypothetical protein BHE74_00054298 [Ensete ventricosum]
MIAINEQALTSFVDAYQSTGEVFEEKAGQGGTQQLGHHVQQRPDDGDVPPHGQPQRHRWVQVAAGDVEPRRDHHRHHQRVSHRHRRQPHDGVPAHHLLCHIHAYASVRTNTILKERRRSSRFRTRGHGGADPSEDEEKGEDHLG